MPETQANPFLVQKAPLKEKGGKVLPEKHAKKTEEIRQKLAIAQEARKNEAVLAEKKKLLSKENFPGLVKAFADPEWRKAQGKLDQVTVRRLMDHFVEQATPALALEAYLMSESRFALDKKLESAVQERYAKALDGWDVSKNQQFPPLVLADEFLSFGVQPDYTGALRAAVQYGYSKVFRSSAPSNLPRHIEMYSGVSPEVDRTGPMADWFSEQAEIVLNNPGYGTYSRTSYAEALGGIARRYGLKVNSFESARNSVIKHSYIPFLKTETLTGGAPRALEQETVALQRYTKIAPDFEQDQEFRQYVFNELRNKLKAGNFFRVKTVQTYVNILGAQIPWKELEEDVRAVYRKQLDEDIPSGHRLNEMKEMTDVSLELKDKDKKRFTRAGSRLLRLGQPNAFSDLQAALSQEDRDGYQMSQHRHDVRMGYEHAIRAASQGDFQNLKYLEISDPNPAELLPTVNKAIHERIVKGDVNTFEGLKEIMHVMQQPIDWKLHEPELRKRYRQWVGEHNQVSLRYFRVMSEIQPDYQGELFEAVQAGYAAMIKKSGDLIDNPSTPFGVMVAETDVQPDYAGKLKPILVQRWNYLLAHGEATRVESESVNIPVKPDYQGELASAVRQGYLVHAKRSAWNMVRQEIDLTGVSPDKGLLTPIATLTLEDSIGDISYGELGPVKDILEITGKRIWDDDVSWRSGHSHVFLTVGVDKLMQAFPSEKTNIMERAKKEAPEYLALALEGSDWSNLFDIMVKYKVRIPEHRLSEMLAHDLAGGGLRPEVIRLFAANKQKIEIGADQLRKVARTQQPRELAMVYRYALPKDIKRREQAKAALGETGDWKSVMGELLDLKGPADREEFDPWKQELTPLLKVLYGSRSVDPTRRDFYGEQVVAARYGSNEYPNVNRGLVEFVKRFGMKNLPQLAMIVIELESIKQTGKITSPPAGLKKFFETHGITEWVDLIGPSDIENILEQIEARMEGIKKEILEDRVPTSFESSPLDMELFNAIVIRGSNYGAVDDRKQLIEQWRTTAELAKRNGKPDSVRVPEGYEPMTMDVVYAGKGEGMESMMRKAEQEAGDENAMETREKKLKILRDKLEAVQKKEPYVKFVYPQVETLCAEDNDPKSLIDVLKAREALLEQARERLHEAMEKEGEKLSPKKKEGMEKAIAKERERVGKLVEYLKHHQAQDLSVYMKDELLRLVEEYAVKKAEWESTEESATEDDQKKLQSQRSSYEGWRKQQEKTIGRLQQLIEKQTFNPMLQGSDQQQGWFETMRLAFGEDLMELAGDHVREQIKNIIQIESPGHLQALKEAYQRSIKNEVTPELREAMAKMYEDELLPHFLDPNNYHKESRKIPFSQELQNTVESFFRTTQIRKQLLEEVSHQHRFGKPSAKPPKHPFFDTLFEARSLESQIEAIEHPEKAQSKARETRQVTFYPGHGLARIFCGDIANACFDRLRNNIAQNQFPDLQAVTMAATEGKDTRILGNFLLIEALSGDGKTTNIIIRALNPTQSTMKEGMNPGDIVERAIEYATEVAKKRGIDRVLMCMDAYRGGHASNVQEVFDAMKAYTNKKKLKTAGSLQHTLETTFNGYSIYVDGQTRVAWEKPQE